MKIKDLAGNVYELDKDTLADVGNDDRVLFHIFLSDIKVPRVLTAKEQGYLGVFEKRKTRWTQLRTYTRDGQEDCGWVCVPVEKKAIGCRTFSPATFAKIFKAAGVKPVRKTKPAKKARRA